MEVKLRTLTPLWTGGVGTGGSDWIHETGIIGSQKMVAAKVLSQQINDGCALRVNLLPPPACGG